MSYGFVPMGLPLPSVCFHLVSLLGGAIPHALLICLSRRPHPAGPAKSQPRGSVPTEVSFLPRFLSSTSPRGGAAKPRLRVARGSVSAVPHVGRSGSGAVSASLRSNLLLAGCGNDRGLSPLVSLGRRGAQALPRWFNWMGACLMGSSRWASRSPACAFTWCLF